MFLHQTGMFIEWSQNFKTAQVAERADELLYDIIRGGSRGRL